MVEILQVCGRIWRWDDRLDKLGIGRKLQAADVPPGDQNPRRLCGASWRCVSTTYARRGGSVRSTHAIAAPPPPPPSERARFISADQGHAVRVHLNGQEYPEAEMRRAEEHVRQLSRRSRDGRSCAQPGKSDPYLRRVEGALEDEGQPAPVDITAEKADLSKRLGKMVWEYACVCVPDGSLPDEAALNKERAGCLGDGRLAAVADGWEAEPGVHSGEPPAPDKGTRATSRGV